MKDTLLDRQLHKLSNEEILIRDRKLQPDYNKFEQVSRGGAPEKLYLMHCSRDGNALFPTQFHPHIIVMRHVRYCEVREHVHDWIELSYMYDGFCTQTINKNVELTLKKGQLLLLDQDSIHSLGDTGENDILINILMDKEYFDEVFFSRFSRQNILVKFLLNAISEKKSHDNYILFQSEKSERVQLYMREILREFMLPSNENSKDVIDNLINLLFLEMVNIYQSDSIFGELKLGKGNSIAIMKYIEANYKICSLESVANIFNMNPNYLSMLLKKNTGYTFKELIQHYRFDYVNMMLCNTAEPIDLIIQKAGYENTTYFYKKFKEKYGCTPKQYRENHGKISKNGGKQ